jgi:hypothetical protein
MADWGARWCRVWTAWQATSFWSASSSDAHNSMNASSCKTHRDSTVPGSTRLGYDDLSGELSRTAQPRRPDVARAAFRLVVPCST